MVSFFDEPEREQSGEPLGRRLATSRGRRARAGARRHPQGTGKRHPRPRISNDEQMAINEEAMSVNEEFQSTNEELETSKEELQSLNEELTALNSQLRTRSNVSAPPPTTCTTPWTAPRSRRCSWTATSTSACSRRRPAPVQRHRLGYRQAARRSGPPHQRPSTCSPTPGRSRRPSAAEPGGRGRQRRLVHPPHRPLPQPRRSGRRGGHHLHRHLRGKGGRTADRSGAVLFRQHHQHDPPTARRARRGALRHLRQPLLLRHFSVEPEETVGRHLDAVDDGRLDNAAVRDFLDRLGTASGSSRITRSTSTCRASAYDPCSPNALEIRDETLAAT